MVVVVVVVVGVRRGMDGNNGVVWCEHFVVVFVSFVFFFFKGTGETIGE